MVDTYLALQTRYKMELKPRLKLLERFKALGITKKALADEITSKEFLAVREEFVKAAEEFIASANDFHKNLYDIKFHLQEAYKNLYELILPLMTDDTLMETAVWQKLMLVTNNTEMHLLQNHYTEDRQKIFDQMISNIFDPFLTYPEGIKISLQHTVKRFELSLSDLHSNLESYLGGTEMEPEFYM